MERTSLHRYATRPGLFLTEDGGADAVVWSETADQLWLSVIEPLDSPSAFYNTATQLPNDSVIPFHEQIAMFPVCSRIVEGRYCRETLFKMEGPNYGMWYVHIPRAWDGMRYGYRASGTWDPRRGVQFNPYKILLDPYAKGIDGKMDIAPEAFSYQCTVQNGRVHGSAYGSMSMLDNLGHTPLSVVIDDRDVHKHEGDPQHPHIPWSKTVIYELHVKGFTKNAPWMEPELRGTYAGLAHPTTIAYLQNLGITSVELLPIFAKQTEIGIAERGLTNYWGYSTLGYFAPDPDYATEEARRKGPAAVRKEVIDMVRALHAGGIEVLLDVVFNHTCEGGIDGPTVCWRGLDAVSYYRRRTDNPGMLIDTTGCGNTFDFTNTRVINYAVDSLRYWSKRIGVDGFRFDLAPTLARLEGTFSKHHPFLYALRSDLMLGNLKMIMEPWDLGEGGWRTGQFGVPFAEWNDHFRDSTRRFWLTDVDSQHRGFNNEIGMQEMATRLCGSADLFATDPGRGAVASINFVSCHDGFTLTDLTRYDRKHNEANGENNQDGNNTNHSFNFGEEGPSDDPAVEARRERAAMNMIGTLLMSLGTPMLLAGDEFRNTQDGNNNAYCQDNDINWLHWEWLFSPEKTPEMRRLEHTTKLIALRKSLDLYHHEEFFTVLSMLGLLKPSSRVQWLLPNGTTPMERDWFDTSVRCFAMRLLANDEYDVVIVINGLDRHVDFMLPDDCEWRMLWSSAETNGRQPRHVSELPKEDADDGTDETAGSVLYPDKPNDSVWTLTIPDGDTPIHQALKAARHHRLAEVLRAQGDHAGDGDANGVHIDDIRTNDAGSDVAATPPPASDMAHGPVNGMRNGTAAAPPAAKSRTTGVKSTPATGSVTGTDDARHRQAPTMNASSDGAANDPWRIDGLSISLFRQIR
ncbi:glycogen debranching protein GlgX [Bifidobacterium saimiriisciurei]|uniref:Glycogen debranching protein GlgX n=1 Tax=Bifidobacterium saimiriisciurei TaxID=2661627 RepID=A0ABX0C8B3_9BIFI|nr:glycogen debranching protein GlgX [Bifidobacterium saimiriisciurei]NEH10951.1 glycogen debranching protein GlgX [Bifidobacterium saimiriisciurei]